MYTHRIFKISEEAVIRGLSWDDAISEGLIETVETYETYQDACDAYDAAGYDPEFFGVE